MPRLLLLAYLGLLAAFGAVLLVLADRVAGRVADPRFTPLAGASGTTTVLARPEFRVRVRTNAAGFRGAELPGPKGRGVRRVVVLGDSFTWGFGVPERQAYPARLERRLNDAVDTQGPGARRIEVVNLGVPGAGPLDYLYHLEHTALRLEPDVVLVGVFANDVNDVYQVRRFGARSPLFALDALRAAGPAVRPWWKRTAETALPNLYALGGRTLARVAAGWREARAASDVGGAPATDPAALVAALAVRYGRRDEVLARYHALDAADRERLDRLLVGEPLGDDVRGALLLGALVDPDGEVDGILLRSEGRRAAWAETAEVLARIVRAARRRGAATVLAVLPASEQVDRSRWRFLEGVGYHVDPAMLEDTRLADGVRAVARREGAGFVDLVRAFRAHRDARLYYVADEHWNARGQAFAAARLAPAVAAALAAPADPS